MIGASFGLESQNWSAAWRVTMLKWFSLSNLMAACSGSSSRFLIEIRFIKFSLTSIAYQAKSSPLEGLARPRALYHDRHPMVRSKGPPVRGPLPCRRAQS